MKIVGQMMIRNEGNRYLDLVIPKILDVVDKLVILDDASTDNTVQICRGFKKTIVYEGKERRCLTDESGLHSELWEHIREQKPDWVLSLDADEVLDINDSFNWDRVFSSEKDWFAVNFYEMWNEQQYRTDGFWSTTITPIFRFQDCSFGWDYKFHCPRFFRGMSKNGGFLEGIKVQHLAYLKDEDKKRKFEFYMKHNLDSPINLAHAKTILDKPELRDYNAELPNHFIVNNGVDKVGLPPIIDKEEN